MNASGLRHTSFCYVWMLGTSALIALSSCSPSIFTSVDKSAGSGLLWSSTHERVGSLEQEVHIQNDSILMLQYLESFQNRVPTTAGLQVFGSMHLRANQEPLNAGIGQWRKRIGLSWSRENGNLVHLRLAQTKSTFHGFGEFSYISLSHTRTLGKGKLVFGDYNVNMGQGLLAWTGWQNPCRSVPECLYQGGNGIRGHSGYYAWSHFRGIAGRFPLTGSWHISSGWSLPSRSLQGGSNIFWSSLTKELSGGKLELGLIKGGQFLVPKEKITESDPSSDWALSLNGHKQWRNTMFFSEWLFGPRLIHGGSITGLLWHPGPKLRVGLLYRGTGWGFYSRLGQRTSEEKLSSYARSGTMNLECNPGYKSRYFLFVHHVSQNRIHGYHDFALKRTELGLGLSREWDQKKGWAQIRYRRHELSQSGSLRGLRPILAHPVWDGRLKGSFKGNYGHEWQCLAQGFYAVAKGSRIPFLFKLQWKMSWKKLTLKPFLGFFDHMELPMLGIRSNRISFQDNSEHHTWYISAPESMQGMSILKGSGMFTGTQVQWRANEYLFLLGMGFNHTGHEEYRLYQVTLPARPLWNLYLALRSR